MTPSVQRLSRTPLPSTNRGRRRRAAQEFVAGGCSTSTAGARLGKKRRPNKTEEANGCRGPAGPPIARKRDVFLSYPDPNCHNDIMHHLFKHLDPTPEDPLSMLGHVSATRVSKCWTRLSTLWNSQHCQHVDLVLHLSFTSCDLLGFAP